MEFPSPHTSAQPATNSEVLRFDNLLKQLLELRKVVYDGHFILEVAVQEQPNGRDAWGQVWDCGWHISSFDPEAPQTRPSGLLTEVPFCWPD